MAVMRVNPTRMELTRLKKRLATAVRGHKLMKDKRDEMMRRFILLVRENEVLRRKVEQALTRALGEFALCRGVMQPEMLDQALLYPARSANMQVGRQNILSINAPVFTLEQDDERTVLPYGLVQTSAQLDSAIVTLAAVLPELVALAEKEKACDLLADEIEKTRRRVNALEYIMIPQLEETIGYIRMKLDENERGGLTRLMKVKAMIEQRRAQ